MRFRPESFGGLLFLERPRLLLWLDRILAEPFVEASSKSRGKHAVNRPGPPEDHRRWRLGSPIEVHMNLSERCSMGCSHCYVDATPEGRQMSPAEACRILDRMAEMGVFHVALGGGESTDYPSLLEVAWHARKRGMVPNLTTNGAGITGEVARELTSVFGQVNVSLDTVPEKEPVFRAWGSSQAAVEALKSLRRHSKNIGINMVVSRRTFPGIEDIVGLAAALDLNEVELLRLKPGGRAGLDFYLSERMTAGQGRALLPFALTVSIKYRVPVRMDCSLVPFLCFHEPDPGIMSFFNIRGCEAGHMLAAVDAGGGVKACSFSPWLEGNDAGAWGGGSVSFDFFENLDENLEQPCKECGFKEICHGGCRAVAYSLTGRAYAPDPECPLVLGNAGDRSPYSLWKALIMSFIGRSA